MARPGQLTESTKKGQNASLYQRAGGQTVLANSHEGSARDDGKCGNSVQERAGTSCGCDILSDEQATDWQHSGERLSWPRRESAHCEGE